MQGDFDWVLAVGLARWLGGRALEESVYGIECWEEILDGQLSSFFERCGEPVEQPDWHKFDEGYQYDDEYGHRY